VGISDLFDVRNKVALVTGGSRGIGLMIARGLVEAGAHVYITSRKADVCAEVAAELSEVGWCEALPADLSDSESLLGLATALGRREERLHVLVNNAGANWGAPLDEYPEVGFDKVLNVNVKAVFFLTQQLIPMLEKAGRPGDPARVINIGSIDGLHVPPTQNFSYSASKAALHHLTRVLCLHLGPRHIAVNAVAPGPFESKMTEWLLGTFEEQITAHCALGRIGAPADMAGVAIFLSSRAGAYLNGTVIPVDGGIHVGPAVRQALGKE
jgi:NAD(P)-dependent dehydrogenase (short-subunit alcohol dehydrogenase family)